MPTHILKNDGKTLGNLLKKVDLVQEYNRLFAQYVDKNIAAHCKASTIQNNCLIIIVDSGNWATQLRFHIPELLQNLRKHPPFEGLKAICCKTRPNPALEKPQNQRNKRKIKSISPATAELLLQSANSISDTKIQHSLKKLIKSLC